MLQKDLKKRGRGSFQRIIFDYKLKEDASMHGQGEQHLAKLRKGFMEAAMSYSNNWIPTTMCLNQPLLICQISFTV